MSALPNPQRPQLVTDDIPQADRLDRVFELVEAIAEDRSSPALLPRDLAYYRHAARLLGLLDEQSGLTPAGESLARASGEQRARLAAQAFAESAVGRAWLAWSGGEHLQQLDEDRAEDFLCDCSDASPATASRRAATLRSWLRALRAYHGPHVDGEAALKLFLAGPVADAAMPTRMLNWAERNDIHTLAELAARSPASLRAERNLGRKSIADTRAFFLERTDMTWEELHETLPRLGFGSTGQRDSGHPSASSEQGPVAPDWKALSWAQLARALPTPVRALPITRFELPARMRTYCTSEGIEILDELLVRSEADLRSARNLGRTTIRDTRRAIVRWLSVAADADSGAGSAPVVLDPAVEDYPDFISLWRQRLASLSVKERMVLSQRVGVGADGSTLEEIGQLLGVSRERVRQIESAAVQRLCRETWWIEGIEARLEEELIDGVVSLTELAADPWFAHVDTREDELRYVLERFARRGWSIDELAGERWLSHAGPGELARVERAIAQALRARDYPCPASEVDALIAAQANELPARFVELLLERFRADLHPGEHNGQKLYTGFGQNRITCVLARVRASTEPVSVRELEEEFGRGALPDELIHVRFGAVMAPQNIPGFFAWQDRIVPACIALMRRDGPARQWSAEELIEALSPVARLPEWLTHWHLAGMLRLSGQVVYLGRLRVCLPENQRETRTFVHEALRAVLLEAGGPLEESVLRSRVEATTAVSDLAWYGLIAAQHGGVVRLSPTEIGLIERDVPGGQEAFAEAAEILSESLAQRQIGLSALQALSVLREADERYERWTRELVHAVGRSSAVLRSAHNGSIGLREWESVRVPGQREIVREAVEEAGGRALVATILDRIESLHGSRPTRATLVNVATSAGARLRGEFVVDASVCTESAAADLGAAFPELSPMEGIPAAAADLVSGFMREPLGDFAKLRQDCLEHARVFQRAAADSEFLSAADAEKLAALCVRLIDSLDSATSEADCRLVWAVGRYFVRIEDAEADLSIGGLDDDIAVANAVARHLGHPEWCVAAPASVPPQPN